MITEIFDADGNRIGIDTVGGPILDLPPEEQDAIREAAEAVEASAAADRALRSAASRKERMSRLKDMAEVAPHMMVDRLEKLTFEERKLVLYALQGGDSVNLPYAVSNVMKTREKRGHTKHAVEVSLHRAAARLYNRGLATVQKMDDGLVWVTVSRERILDAIRRDITSKEGRGADDFNLMKVPCEIQTSPKRDPLDMPRRCSGQRLQACRLLTGVRMLSKADKAEINYRFESYTDETNEKIIALLDARSGEVIGSEYSTRFNDLSKAARTLNKFDYALDKSLQDHSKAVFLTLTTDPNLTDEEREKDRESRRRFFLSKLADPTLSKAARDRFQKGLYQVEGPDYEISDLETRIASDILSPADLRSATARLTKLRTNKEEAEKLMAQLDDPETGIRTKERIVQSLKKLGRWTYTHDPEGFENLWEADRSFSPAWNRFMSYLKKVNSGKRPQYLAAFEFTESGLLHIHVLIFLEYLLPNDKISLEWRRCGQGEITYIYALRNVINRETGKREWRWNSQSRPHEAKGMSGGDYLKKYIRKCALALMDSYTSPADTYSMYWALNKRMFTCSRSLMERYDGKRVEVGEEDKPSSFSLYRILSTEEADEIVDRMVYHRVRPGWQDGQESSEGMGEASV